MCNNVPETETIRADTVPPTPLAVKIRAQKPFPTHHDYEIKVVIRRHSYDIKSRRYEKNDNEKTKL